MLSLLKAIVYFVCHPFDVVKFTIVRRYVDAQGNYIGELYDDIRMIGASCDNGPLNASAPSLSVCYRKSFLEPLPANTLRVGAFEPGLNAIVQAYVALRRFNRVRVAVHNRFVEHVLGLTV